LRYARADTSGESASAATANLAGDFGFFAKFGQQTAFAASV
jgi:hypothetical protein